MAIKVRKIIEKLEELAPIALAEAWDNCGLQIGSGEENVNGILVALDVDEKAVDKAQALGANLIITHHPLFFQGVKKIDYGEPRGQLIRRLISQGMTVYAAHTNLDLASGGLNDFLAARLGLVNILPLGKVKIQKLFKLVVFVPESHLEQVRQGINDAGAGSIGNYRDCSFRQKGIGTFRPLEGSQPFLGEIGALEEADEYRLEVIVPEEKLNRIVSAMLHTHPYEEVAHDIIPLANQGMVYSYGRQGELFHEVSLLDLAETVKGCLGLDHVAVAGNHSDRKIKKVGIAAGAGSSMIKIAGQESCDVLITGDIKYHEAQEALEKGLSLIDAGHDGLELGVADMLVPYLTDVGRKEGWGIDVHGYRAVPLWKRI
ncbi:MAG: Nif3-like dinuclear metal center hexameric protein [Syntrophomonadaceae bacterium]|nr:Nif3-like dinuclear metal center hexameric protein [Syntrophomonadaceae bacterium]